MKRPLECEFESEVLAAALQSHWPEDAGALQQHAAECPICADIVAIATTLDLSRQELRAAAQLPDPGTVWWRSQLRARREAAVSAGRPITGIQVLALACAMGILAAYFRIASGWPAAIGKWCAMLAAPFADHLIIAVVAVVLIFLLPAAVLLAAGRD